MLYANGCNEVLWTEYAKGKYNLTPGRLYFNGIYTEADYSEKTGGCYNIGAYADSFSVKYCNSYLVLYGLSPALSNSVDRTINLAKE